MIGPAPAIANAFFNATDKRVRQLPGRKVLTSRHSRTIALSQAAISGVIIAVVYEIAKRYPSIGALFASLPLVSVLGMIWLWNDKPDKANMAALAGATFWYVLPSLPMFLLIPALLRRDVDFWPSLVAGGVLTIMLYAGMTWAAPRFRVRL